MNEETVTYHYRGPIERGVRYSWNDGYSANSASGHPQYPWMTKRECRADAKRQGKRAVFLRGALAVGLLLVLTACGPDGFISIQPGPDAAPDALELDGAAPDATDERPPSADASDAGADVKTDAACELSGSMECTDVVGAYCARYAACCAQMPGSGNCSVGFDVPATCKAFYTQNGYDCPSGKYAKAVCASGGSCSGKIGAASCAAMFVSSGPNDSSFATCPAFWAQF